MSSDPTATAASRKLPGVDAAEAMKRLGLAAKISAEQSRRFVHVMWHRGEGQDPRRCEWCREAVKGA